MRRAVGLWLLLMAVAVLVQVGLGGITRLTDSGLSITEWKPILGVIPPHDEPGWTDAFEKYQQLPQFKKLKSHLTLSEFKFIYFWEWFHRLWGRFLGVFFAVPFLVFWRKGALGGLQRTLVTLFILGGLQGVLGWFMVMSGLSELVYVSHFRLAAHYLFALALLGALVWYGAPLAWPDRMGSRPHLVRSTNLLLGLLGLQLAWGAFMAGLKAVLYAPTWPTINGSWVPEQLWTESPFSSPLPVHFIHRTLAYVLLAGLVWWWARAKSLSTERHAVVALGLVQVVLGVLTVLNAPVAGRLLWLGLAHQLVGSLLFAALVLARRFCAAQPA